MPHKRTRKTFLEQHSLQLKNVGEIFSDNRKIYIYCCREILNHVWPRNGENLLSNTFFLFCTFIKSLTRFRCNYEIFSKISKMILNEKYLYKKFRFRFFFCWVRPFGERILCIGSRASVWVLFGASGAQLKSLLSKKSQKLYVFSLWKALLYIYTNF